MDGFPTEEEEFELMYQDELEVLREQEDFEPAPKSRKSLNFSEPNSQLNTTASTDFIPLEQHGSIDRNTQQVSNEEIKSTQSTVGNKRSIEELFGDIDDILREGIFKDAPLLKKHKKSDCENADLALIEHIVQLRNANRERIIPTCFSRDYSSTGQCNRENISLEIPKYPFIGLVNHEGERVYLRCHSEEYEVEERNRINRMSNFIGVMGSAFGDIWKEAIEYINKGLEQSTTSRDITPIETSKDLWVDIYKPRNYCELLSDEGTNRSLLKWLKLWDKAVFNRKPKIKMRTTEEKSYNPSVKRQELSLELDPDGRPKYKVALLCGPPGLGKTTLAHMVAKHCGYNVVEINASDDRNLQNFKNALENSTSMKSVLDIEKKPNCLVFDEIDGAPNNSIEYLIKFINGVEGGKKLRKVGDKKVKEKNQLLKRPIICICNDVYVPALRGLRQIAFIVNFPPTTSTRLAERLSEIARHQNIKTDMGALLALAEKTHNDIRSCLSILYFFKTQDKPVTLSDIWKTSIGQKDMQKGLFAVWQDIFQVGRPKGQKATGQTGLSLEERRKKVLNTVQSFGDYERLTQGVFENFPLLQVKDSTLVGTVEAEEWFCFNDVLNTRIMRAQDYGLGVYVPYGFVMWHFVFGGVAWPKINFPNAGYEARAKAKKREGLIAEILKGMRPSVRTYVHPSSLKLEILPYLNHIIIPPFRPVNLHLYTEREKEMLKVVVGIMIDYNLNYVQERTLEGSYAYNLDPNLEEVVTFPGFKSARTLSYSNKQMIGQEIEMEKMRRIEGVQEKMRRIEGDVQEKKNELPNHLQKLQVKSMKPNTPMVTKDFFGRVIARERPEGRSQHPGGGGGGGGGDIWYQFKEGFTNAVRKSVKVKFLK